MRFALRMQLSGAMGLPLRIALPLFVGIAALFLAVMGYLVKAGLGNSEAPLGLASPSAARNARVGGSPAPLVTDAPGTFTIPQTGTGPRANASALPGTTVGGGGPPAAVRAALDDLRARLKANPNDLAALVGLADLYFDAGKFDQALPYYRRALALDPSNPDVRTDEATALHQTGHDLEALRELDTVLRTRPGFPQALYNRGIVLRAIGRRSDAVATFKKFVEAAPQDPRAEDARANLRELGG
jgi:tetratricopeptide (TPR) repeat protein